LFAAASDALLSHAASASAAPESMSELSIAHSQRLNQRLITDLMEVTLFRNILTSLPAADAPVDSSSSSSSVPATSYLESLIAHLVKELTLLEGWMSNILPLSPSYLSDTSSSSPLLRGVVGSSYRDDDADDDEVDDIDDSVEGVDDDLQQKLVDDDDQILSRFSAVAFSPALLSEADAEEAQVMKDLSDAIVQSEKRWQAAPSKDDDGVDKKELQKKQQEAAAADFSESVSDVQERDDDDGMVEKVLEDAIQQLRESDGGLSSYPYYASDERDDEKESEGQQDDEEGENVAIVLEEAAESMEEAVEGEEEFVENNESADYLGTPDYLPNSEDGSEEEVEEALKGEGQEENFSPSVSISSLFENASESSVPSTTSSSAPLTGFSQSVWDMVAEALKTLLLQASSSPVTNASSLPKPMLPVTQEESAELSPSLRGSANWSEEKQ
jgi:hypothetical protein